MSFWTVKLKKFKKFLKNENLTFKFWFQFVFRFHPFLFHDSNRIYRKIHGRYIVKQKLIIFGWKH
jgi:hypothetical protein